MKEKIDRNKKPQALPQKGKVLLGDSNGILSKKCIKVKKQFISKSRLKQYKNLREYKENLEFCKSFYIPLAMLEIGLRNSLDLHFQKKVGRDWLLNETFIKPYLKDSISQAKKILVQQRKSVNQDNLIAELSFGFWILLLKKPYQEYLRYKDLKIIFPNMPRLENKVLNRRYFFTIINEIRLFRNKIFHFDKIINKKEYLHIKNDILFILSCFDENLVKFVKKEFDSE